MIPARAGSVHRTQTRNRPIGARRRPGDFHFVTTPEVRGLRQNLGANRGFGWH
jgi:hypothetical protein